MPKYYHSSAHRICQQKPYDNNYNKLRCRLNNIVCHASKRDEEAGHVGGQERLMTLEKDRGSDGAIAIVRRLFNPYFKLTFEYFLDHC